MSAKMKTGILGMCPVCEGEFKVRDGKLVHHGFQRPGDGRIHGDCFAVAYEPYERSTHGCEDYKQSLVVALTSLQTRLKMLPRISYFCDVRPGYYTTTTHEYALGVTSLYTWSKFVESKLDEVKRSIAHVESEIARMNKRIAAWALCELREVTEEAATAATKVLRDARAAERAAKNATKSDKRKALDDKRNDRAAKREAAFVALVATLNAFDAQVKSDERKREVLAAWAAFFSPKTKRELGSLSDFMYEFRKRSLDALLVQLDIATRDAHGYVNYPSWTYYG